MSCGLLAGVAQNLLCEQAAPPVVATRRVEPPPAAAILGAMSSMRYRPCDELVEVLAPAFAPCPEFTGACTGTARWAPGAGHVPRGFIGALGELDDVEAVLILAEPGDPQPAERYAVTTDPVATIEGVCRFVFGCFDRGVSPFHRFTREVLDLAYPAESLARQLRRVWITESVLCSAARSTASVDRRCEDACVSRYLAAQLALLPGRVVIPFGVKARERISRRGLAHEAGQFHALGLPYANRAEARESRVAAAELLGGAHRDRG
ncbi:MAG: hypothetical protein ACXWZ2_12540 [Mycobacterium sp.]